MIVKLLGSTAIIIASILIGNIYAIRMKNRSDFLFWFNHDLVLLKTRISEREKLSRAFAYVGNFSVYPKVWISFSEMVDSVGVKYSIEKTIQNFADELNLDANDIKIIEMLANGLGASDVESQIEHIEYVSDMIKKAAESAKNKYDKNCKLYRSASILVGIMLVLILL